MVTESDPEGTETKHLLRFAELTPSDGKRVLEVGCGDGRLTWRYAEAVNYVFGIDVHADDLRIALVDRPANLVRIAHFARADALHLPIPNNSFDLAIFAWSF